MVLICIGFITFFLALTGGAIIAHLIPSLTIVARHGKILSSSDMDTKFHSIPIRIASSINIDSFTISFLRHFEAWTVSKSYFLYFYILGTTMTALCLALELREYARIEYHWIKIEVLIALILLGIHCVVRFYECLYSTEYGSSRMHISGLFVGLIHYILVPASLCSTISFDCSLIKFCNTHMIEYLPKYLLDSEYYVVSESFRWTRYSVALFLFVLASVYQVRCHSILIDLKRKNFQIPNEVKSQYSLPVGSLFEYVCCPHYLCEMIVYMSLFLVRPSPVQIASLVWVSVNLAVVAQQQFTYYQKRFPEEMKRKHIRRLVPFLW